MSNPRDIWAENIRYRTAYGHASNMTGGCDANGQRLKPDPAAVFVRVCRLMKPADEAECATIQGGVDDAIARRRPRW